MSRTRRTWACLALLALGCQAQPAAPTGPGTAASPPPATPASPPPSPPAAAPSPSAAAGPSASPEIARTVVVGQILDDQGTVIAAARLEVKASDPALDRIIDRTGGAFGLRDLPVGTRLTLTASAPGYTTRTRTVVVQPPSDTDERVNRADFGGSEEGMWFYLAKHPEIARVEPANQAMEVAASPLRVAFTFSHAIDEDDRPRLGDLLRVVPTYSVGDDEELLRPGIRYGGSVSRLTWDDDGLRAVFTYDGAIVARQPDAGLSVEFDEDASLEAWPRDTLGQVLGLGLAPRTRDGSGAGVELRVAPFARGLVDEPRPSTRPSPLALWGFTHHTTARFTLARDLTPLKVEAVDTLPVDDAGAGGFLVTFNKPVWAYPASALADATTDATNFRYVVGRTSSREDREEFEEAKAAVGSKPSLGVVYDPKFPLRLKLRVPASAFEGWTRYKLFVGPKVEDVYGVSLGGEGVVLEGSL